MNKKSCSLKNLGKTLLVSSLIFAQSNFAYSTSFTINDGTSVTVGQVLDSSDETGVINSGGQLNTFSEHAITVTSASDVVITNNGTIAARTSGDAISTSSASDLTVTNNSSIEAAGTGINVDGNRALITNSSTGTITADDHGIYAEGDDIVINNAGSITTNDSADAGITFDGDAVTVNNSGTITASFSDGIVAEADGSTINNSGSINASEYGVAIDASNVELNNTGQIISNEYGVYIEDFQAKVVNDGTIMAMQSNGIYADDYSGVEITNNGEIIAVADYAINTESRNSTVTNNGTVTASDDIGIYAEANNVVIVNNGTINSQETGIDGEGNDISATNNGIINANDGDGISLDGEDSVAVNNGVITSTLSSNDGLDVSSDSTNAVLTNNGTITMLGDRSSGIESGAIGVEINNSGTVSVSGDDSFGINSDGENSTITNSGKILVTGANSSGVDLDRESDGGLLDTPANSVLINSGEIIATKSSSHAIFGGNGDQNVTLNKGSKIIGKIDLSGGTDSITINGQQGSARIKTSNVETITLGANTNGVIVNGTAHLVDPTSVSMLTIGVNNLSNNIHNSINSHLNDFKSDKNSPIWVQVFGDNFERGEDGNNTAFKNNNFGIIGGIDKEDSGLFFGFNRSNFSTNQKSFEGNANSFFAGAYKKLKLAKATTLTGNLTLGYEKYENRRHLVDNIRGEIATNADLNNFFISPSLNLQHKIKVSDAVELRPNASVNYLASIFDKHKENGAGEANIVYKRRKIQAFNGQAGIDAAISYKDYAFLIGLGIDSRAFEEDNVSANVENTDFNFAANSDKRVTGQYLKLGAQTNIKDLNFSANLKLRKASNDEKQGFGSLNLGYKF